VPTFATSRFGAAVGRAQLRVGLEAAGGERDGAGTDLHSWPVPGARDDAAHGAVPVADEVGHADPVPNADAAATRTRGCARPS